VIAENEDIEVVGGYEVRGVTALQKISKRSSLCFVQGKSE
jgi:hypothetical protein